jgi:hypothetical protein
MGSQSVGLLFLWPCRICEKNTSQRIFNAREHVFDDKLVEVGPLPTHRHLEDVVQLSECFVGEAAESAQAAGIHALRQRSGALSYVPTVVMWPASDANQPATQTRA